jgi:Smr domain
MLFSIGTKVKLRFTGETGVITALLDDGMLMVRMGADPDLEIPAFEEDLVRDVDAEPKLSGAKFIQGQQIKKPEPPPRRHLSVQYVILRPKGVQIVFEPMPGSDGTVSRYKVWLLNDTVYEFIFDFKLDTISREIGQHSEKLSAVTAIEICDLIFDDLNDGLEAWCSLQRITTQGLDTPLERSLKIRPKQFFNNFNTAPVLNVPAHQFILFDSFEPANSSSNATETLQEYAKEHQKKTPKSSSGSGQKLQINDLEAFANFIPEIDLHIENLINGHVRLDKSEILRIQLLHFHRFLDKAIRLGAARIFVIHGVGEGKLRNAIAEQLRSHPHVRKFKNEYHHKYGYGATEVILE